jgi:hypothetical protein
MTSLLAAMLVAIFLAHQSSPAGVSLTGTITEDRNGNTMLDAGDAGSRTLVELFRLSNGQYGPGGASVFATEAGRFEFLSLAVGEYELWVWWDFGFITPQHPRGAGALIIPLSVDAAAAARGENINYEFLTAQKPEGAIPWPVRSGQGNIPEGSVTLEAAAAAQQSQSQPSAGTIRAPSTGDGALAGSEDSLLSLALILVGGLLIGSGLIVKGVAHPARKS